MSQQFVKGYTNNHLTWVMVDATDFATPESALSAATKIKVYGKVKGATGVNFVSSGTGSLTNDIQHVGASALGIYTIALAKADLSDASNAWYDQYIISLSATGAAYQTLVVYGGIMESYLSNIVSYLSNIESYLSNMESNLSGVVSDIRSDVSDMHSDLLVMSGILSDAYSMLTAQSDAVSNVYSAVLLAQSMASDAHSAASDLRSVVRSMLLVERNSTVSATGNTSTIEIAGSIDHDDCYNGYFVRLLGGSQAQELRLIVDTDKTNSRITVKPAFLSTVASGVDYVIFPGAPWLSNVHSDIQSRISDVGSDLRSYLVGLSGTLSDTYSAVLLTQSLASDAHSAAVVAQSISASDMSDLRSAIAAGPAATITASDISDIASAVWAAKYTAHSAASSFGSLFSDVYSRVVVIQSAASDAASAATQANSRVLLCQSRISDAQSFLSDFQSDLLSHLDTTGVGLNASTLSDLRSAISAGPAATVTASDISDIASAVWAAKYTAHSAASSFGSLFSDVYSRLVLTQSAASDAASAATQANSRVLLNQSRVSDVYSMLSDFYSDFQSRVTGTVASASDVASKVWAEKYTAASNVKASTFGSLVRINMSRISDIYSAVSDLQSDFQSRVPKAVATNSQLSDLASDLRSYLVGISASVSDLQSALAAGVTVAAGGITSASFAAGAIDAAALAAGAGQEIADEILNRNLAGSGSGNTRNVRNALRTLRNKVTNSAGVYTVYQEDDITKAYSGATSTAAGNPIVSIDPS